MIRLEDPEWPLTAEQRFGRSVLVDLSRVVPTDASDAVTLRIVRDSRSHGDLPSATLVEPGDGVVRIQEHALASVARIVAATAEQRSSRADRYGRVPVEDNLLVSSQREREPVVSAFAAAVRTAVVEAAGRRCVALTATWPEGRRWAMAMSHDLDVVAAWPLFTALRAAELARKGRLRDLAAVGAKALQSIADDPVWKAARHVLGVERRLGIRSTWFVITATPTLATMQAGDVTYTPESPPARRILGAVRDGGHEIALHGSFETFRTSVLFATQRDRLTRLTGLPVLGVRQHFIRMRPGATHAAMQSAGFEYHSTFGFPDRNGFRIGAADVVPVWNDAEQTVLSVDELPFTWMDRSLSKYRGVEDPRAWVEDALQLAKACQDVGGAWVGIWHPNLTTALGYPGADAAFESLCEGLMRDEPWAATMAEIVAWRRRRRAVRAIGLAPDGTLRVPTALDVAVEAPDGRPLRTVTS